MGDGLVLLIDDVRSFRDRRGCLIARTATEAVDVLHQHREERFAELWLDFDLGPDGRMLTVMPAVSELVRAALADEPYDIGQVIVHSANPRGALAVRRALEPWYPVQRSYDLTLWVNRRTEGSR